MMEQEEAVRPRALRVLVADDDPEVCDALAELVDVNPFLEVAAVAGTADEAVARAREQVPDVAVIDVRMAGGGHQAVRGVRAESPTTKVIALSAYDDHSAVIGMIGAGAVGYLVKGAPGHEIVAAIHRAASGDATLSAEVATQVVGELSDQLSQREGELAERQRLLALVEQALTSDSLEAVYQPIVQLAERRICGVEALARFELEPPATPDQWFASAWRVGRGVELELAAVATALRGLEAVPEDQFLSINASPETLCAPGFAQLLPSGSHPRIVVELTEHAGIEDYDTLEACLDELRRAGVRLAIDDAGAGYASLRHILRLAPDIIKLDMSLTRNLHTDRRRRALVAALVPFAVEIGATVIAEGIETEAELSTLEGYGIRVGQGFLLGYPAPLEGHVIARPPHSSR